MHRKLLSAAVLLSVIFLSGCSSVGNKTMNISVIYAITCICSFALLVGYCKLLNRREPWFVVLFSAVLIINIGYYSLAISDNLNQALWSNRVAYLGSVFLPLSMFMIISDVCKIKPKKNITGLLLFISIAVFLIAASPGYSDIYYKEVSFEVINGVSVLNKTYGKLHCIYLYYLMVYFASMLLMIGYASVKNKIESNVLGWLLVTAVFVNIGVWFIGQLVSFNFEFLSVSYIITELFLLGLYMMLQENENVREDLLKKLNLQSEVKNYDVETDPDYEYLLGKCCFFKSQLQSLTPTEKKIFNFYVEGKSTKEIMAELNIKENTLKYHNKNIYGKLGVSSRKELVKIYEIIKKENEQ